MSRKTRWILFCIAATVFLLLSHVMVVYALGYKYDFVAWKFVRTGSFRVIMNTSADVYVNTTLAGTTAFLSNSYSKGRLLPRTYDVRLEQSGYHPWEKKISITAGYFSDYPKIVLVPLELPVEPVASDSFGFPMPDAVAYPEVRATKDKLVAFDEHSITITWLANTDYQPFHVTGDQETILRLPQKIDDVQWYKDREHILVLSNGILYFSEIDKRGGLNSFELTTVKGPFFYSEDDDAVYKMDGDQIVKLKF